MYQNLIQEKKAHLKEYRRQNAKNKVNEIKLQIKIIDQRLCTFSHIADGIAWQLLGGEIHIARRLSLQEKSSKYLKFSNIESAIEVSNQINSNPLDFALISDLTHYIHAGDLLVRQSNKLLLIELKEGKVNKKIMDFYDSIKEEENINLDAKLNETFDQNTVKQAKRMLRQKQRGNQIVDIIKNDKGIDPVSGGKVNIVTPTIITEQYHAELKELYEKLKEKTWSYAVVDSCIHIGMYRDKGLNMANFAINETLKVLTDNYIIIDWLSITQNLSEPIFHKPFPANFKIDFLVGKIKIIIGIDFDALIKLWNNIGLRARWMSKKETSKYKNEAPRNELVEINHRGIVVKSSQENELIITGGTLSKILYDNIRPSSIAKIMLSVKK